MSLQNFGLLASIWGKSAVILKVEFQERAAGTSRWQALVIARDGQMLFSSIKGIPRSWLSLDKAFAELKAAVPLNTDMQVITAFQMARRVDTGRNRGELLNRIIDSDKIESKRPF
jgi:hypothetical protein